MYPHEFDNNHHNVPDDLYEDYQEFLSIINSPEEIQLMIDKYISDYRDVMSL